MPFDRDLAALKQMTEALPEYLLAEVAFWPLGGSSDFPKLSLGSYALTRARLAASPAHAEAAAPLNQAADGVLARWASNAERKAAAELHTRVHLWGTYLGERHGRYATEVAHRAMLTLLLQRFPGLAANPDAQRLPALDAQLRAQSTAGPFVWDPALQPAFPPDDFWYLYRTQ